VRNGTIEIKLPYPVKLGPVYFNRKRMIGFSFDQRCLFNVLQNNDIDLQNHGKWLKETDRTVIVSETLFAGAQSYCQERRVKDNFTKQGLVRAIASATDQERQQIIDCYMQSEKLGYKRLPGKKKAVTR